MLARRKNGFRTALVTMGLLAVVSTSPANASLVLTGSPVAGSIPGGGSFNELLSDPRIFGGGTTTGIRRRRHRSERKFQTEIRLSWI